MAAALGTLLLWAIKIYFYIIIAEIVISWLVVFDVINVRDPRAERLTRLLSRLTDPAMKPVRKYVPPVGGFDLSPLIVILGLFILERIIFAIFF